MNTRQLPILLLAIPLSSSLAQAQTAGNGKDNSTLAGLFWTFAPILIIAAVMLWYHRRIWTPKEKRSAEHMQRVEQSLDRIAQALERKDKG